MATEVEDSPLIEIRLDGHQDLTDDELSVALADGEALVIRSDVPAAAHIPVFDSGTPNDGDMLYWDDGNGYWSADVPPITINGSPTDGQMLYWDNSNSYWYPDDAPSGGGVSDHGALTGLDDDDHSAVYYSQSLLDGGQLDNRYFTEAEHVNSSSGAGNAGDPIKLNASGLVDSTMLGCEGKRVITYCPTSSSSSETGSGTHTFDIKNEFAAGDMNALGTVVVVQCFGRHMGSGFNSTATTFTLTLGGTTLETTTSANITASSVKRFHLTWQLVVRTAGASGKVHAVILDGAVNDGTLTTLLNSPTAAGITIDLTAANDLELDVTWVANGNTATLDHFAAMIYPP